MCARPHRLFASRSVADVKAVLGVLREATNDGRLQVWEGLRVGSFILFLSFFGHSYSIVVPVCAGIGASCGPPGPVSVSGCVGAV